MVQNMQNAGDTKMAAQGTLSLVGTLEKYTVQADGGSTGMYTRDRGHSDDHLGLGQCGEVALLPTGK